MLADEFGPAEAPSHGRAQGSAALRTVRYERRLGRRYWTTRWGGLDLTTQKLSGVAENRGRLDRPHAMTDGL